MTRISAITLSLLLMIGLTAEAQAVTSGAVKCVALQGPTGPDLVGSVVVLYNPNNGGNQKITRLRVYDSTGATLVDLSFAPPTEVPGRGSFPISLVGTTPGLEGIQVKVNWRQGADAAPMIGRLNLLVLNGDVGTTSASQSNCP